MGKVLRKLKESKIQIEDKWPKEWKRPFYGPEVIARDLIQAGENLLKKVKEDEQKRRKVGSSVTG